MVRETATPVSTEYLSALDFFNELKPKVQAFSKEIEKERQNDQIDSKKALIIKISTSIGPYEFAANRNAEKFKSLTDLKNNFTEIAKHCGNMSNLAKNILKSNKFNEVYTCLMQINGQLDFLNLELDKTKDTVKKYSE